MIDDQLDDLKQFIDSRISQSEQLIRTELGSDIAGLKKDVSGIKEDLQVTNQKIDDGFAGVGEAIEQINQRLDEQRCSPNIGQVRGSWKLKKAREQYMVYRAW